MHKFHQKVVKNVHFAKRSWKKCSFYQKIWKNANFVKESEKKPFRKFAVNCRFFSLIIMFISTSCFLDSPKASKRERSIHSFWLDSVMQKLRILINRIAESQLFLKIKCPHFIQRIKQKEQAEIHWNDRNIVWHMCLTSTKILYVDKYSFVKDFFDLRFICKDIFKNSIDTKSKFIWKNDQCNVQSLLVYSTFY